MRACLKPNLLRSLPAVFSVSAAVMLNLVALPGVSQIASSGSSPAGAPATTSVDRPTLKSGSKGNEVTELQSTLKLLGFYNGSVDGVYGQTTVNAVYSFQQAAGLEADGIAGPATWQQLFPPTPLFAATSAAGGEPVAFPQPTQPTVSVPPPAVVKPLPTATQPTGSVASSSMVVAAVKQPGTTAGEPGKIQSPGSEAIFPVLRVGMNGPAVVGLQHRLRAIGLLKSAADGVFGPETQDAVKAAQRKFKLEADGVVGPVTWRELMH